MSAVQQEGGSRGERHPLSDDPSPSTVRAWLLPEDRDRFLADYDRAVVEARATLDLSTVHAVVEHWRRIAILQTDPDGYRRTVRVAAELATGRASPDDEPFELTRAKAGL